jgi:hypothetical protein
LAGDGEPRAPLKEDLIKAKLATSPAGTNYIPLDKQEDCRAVELLGEVRPQQSGGRVVPSATKCGLLKQCSGLWHLLWALTSNVHCEDSCVTLDLVDGIAHFVSARWSALEVLPLLLWWVMLLAPLP